MFFISRYLKCFKFCNNNKNIEHKSTLSYLTNDDIYLKTEVFIPPIKGGKCIKVYDGDTITIISKLPYDESPLYRFSIRINSIDCPEIKGKDNDEKEVALLAKKEMTELVFNKNVELINLKNEKYGRILADVYINDYNVANHMLEKRLAVSYNGKTKKSPQSWLKYYITGEFN